MKRIYASGPRELLRWIFRRGNQLLTCQLTKRVNGREFVLSLVPHWDRDGAGAEILGTSLAALQRHAAVVTTLRESGWRVVAYSVAAPRSPLDHALDRRAA